MQQRIHWLPEEVPLADDVKDWQHKLTAAEKNLLAAVSLGDAAPAERPVVYEILTG